MRVRLLLGLSCIFRNHRLFHKRYRDHALVVEAIHKIPKLKWLARKFLVMGIFGHQTVNQNLAGDIAGSISRLAEIE